MATHVFLVLALVTLASADDVCTEGGDCDEEVHAVHLLQTHLQLNQVKNSLSEKASKSSRVRDPANAHSQVQTNATDHGAVLQEEKEETKEDKEKENEDAAFAANLVYKEEETKEEKEDKVSSQQKEKKKVGEKTELFQQEGKKKDERTKEKPKDPEYPEYLDKLKAAAEQAAAKAKDIADQAMVAAKKSELQKSLNQKANNAMEQAQKTAGEVAAVVNDPEQRKKLQGKVQSAQQAIDQAQAAATNAEANIQNPEMRKEMKEAAQNALNQAQVAAQSGIDAAKAKRPELTKGLQEEPGETNDDEEKENEDPPFAADIVSKEEEAKEEKEEVSSQQKEKKKVGKKTELSQQKGKKKDEKTKEKSKDSAKSKEADMEWSDVWLCLGCVCGLLGLGFAIGDHFEMLKTGSDYSKYVAEFVGTFMLVFSVGCNVLKGDSTWAVTSIACTLMVMIYALGGVSGGNFNPAVSISLGLSDKMPWAQVAIYICMQLASGLCAAVSYGCMLGKTFSLGPQGDNGIVVAGLAEMFYTFMLAFVVLNVAATKAHAGNQFYGLAIGFTVVAGGYGAGSISGGCFNPAIAIAVAFSSFSQGFGQSLCYVFFEIAGCAIASVFFRVCRNDELEGDVSDRIRMLTSEFLGTYMLVLTVGLNVLNSSPAAAFSIAASLMCMVFALGSVSGAHFNPAVTVAVWLRKGSMFTSTDAVSYISTQFAAGICAACTYAMMMDGQTVALAPKVDNHSQALIGEFVFTFLLCFVVLCVATVEKPLSQFFGLAIGACVIAGGYAIGNISGGSLNPAVSAGLAISDCIFKGGPVLAHLRSYIAMEFAGGSLAAAVFGYTHWAEVEQKS